MSLARQLAAVALLPVTVALVVPGLVLWRTGAETGRLGSRPRAEAR